MESKSQPTHVVVVGLGLIGGSLAGSLRAAGTWRVIGFDANDAAARTALDEGLVDDTAGSFEDAVSSADAALIVLATPVSTVLSNLEQLQTLAPAGATVMDVGSTKRAVNEAMNRLPPQVRAIGGHPMTGRLTSGAGGASADLFRERTFVLVSNDRTDNAADEIASRVVRDVGAVEVRMDAVTHDRVVAMISHVPHFMSFALLKATGRLENNWAWQLAAGGYRNATANAVDNPPMWQDIAGTNGDMIAEALRSLAGELDALADVMESPDDIDAVLDEARKLYEDKLGG